MMQVEQTSQEKSPPTAHEPLQDTVQRSVYLLFLCAFVLSGSLIVASDVLFPSQTKVALEVGQVAPQDILAPRSLKYESDVLWQAKRDAQVAAVRPIYDPPDPSVKSDQLQLARLILDYIENVRYDDYATVEQKTSDLMAITDLNLSPEVIDALLSITDHERWRDIDAQVMRLLERVLSGEIREDNIQAKRDDLSNLISASYSESEVTAITGIVRDLIRVNAYYNEELTRQAQLEAAENVPAEVRTFARGQMIIRAGEIATSAHIEALEQFGLLQQAQRKGERFVGGVLAMSAVAVILGTYLWKFHRKLFEEPPFILLLGVLFLVFLGGVRIVDVGSLTQPYYFPASALAFLVTTFVGPQFAIMLAAVFAGLAGVMLGGSLEFAILIGSASILGVLSLDRTERLNAYFVAGGVVGASGMMVAIFFALGSEAPPAPIVVLTQVVGSAINGLLSAAVALAGLYVISNALNIPTSLKIAELLQPNHPLLQRLLREAPGTYQHSLQVANLAELGAQRVGANGALLRVAAMYHDVGKILNPHFFVENQADGVNPHDVLDDPLQSARIIIGHVTEGVRLARQYRLPNRIRDFISEHHGTTQVAYFVRKAQERHEQGGAAVDVSAYTYPGPRPRSRETAILMLADGCESSVRARRPQSKDDIRETVDFIFEKRLQTGQLDESGLTLNDLKLLRDTFLTALQGVFHPRIAYPRTPSPAREETEPAPKPLKEPEAAPAVLASDTVQTVDPSPDDADMPVPPPEKVPEPSLPKQDGIKSFG